MFTQFLTEEKNHFMGQTNPVVRKPSAMPFCAEGAPDEPKRMLSAMNADGDPTRRAFRGAFEGGRT